MSAALKVTAEALRQMFMAAGFPAAKDWDNDKLKDNLFKINDIVGDDTEIDGEDNKELAAALMVAIGKGDPVDVDWDASTGEASDSEEPAAPPESKPAKGKNKEKKVATKKQDKTNPGKPTKAAASKAATKPTKEGPGKGYRILGHSSTSVIHWMAGKGYGFDEAKKVLSKFKITEISDENLKARLSVGRNKDRAKPANLSKDEVAQLKKIIG